MLKLPHALLIGLFFIATALFFGGQNPVVGQDNAPRGPFTVSASSDQNFVWRIDQATGLVSYCYRDSTSLDRTLIRNRPPYCSGWGN